MNSSCTASQEEIVAWCYSCTASQHESTGRGVGVLHHRTIIQAEKYLYCIQNEITSEKHLEVNTGCKYILLCTGNSFRVLNDLCQKHRTVSTCKYFAVYALSKTEKERDFTFWAQLVGSKVIW